MVPAVIVVESSGCKRTGVLLERELKAKSIVSFMKEGTKTGDGYIIHSLVK